jgi:hypothetical protein
VYGIGPDGYRQLHGISGTTLRAAVMTPAPERPRATNW